MSCDNASGPVDIKHDSTTLTCDLKCNFTYKYNISRIDVTKNNLYLSLKLANNDSQTVTYTSNKGIGVCSEFSGGGNNYIIDEIRIYSPSLHTYNGNRADGEMIIYHKNMDGGKQLIVCIPISSSVTVQNNASKQLTEIINNISNSSNIQGSSFNLNNFIPDDYFYTYTANLPYYPCSSCIDYIVFDNGPQAISISSSTLKVLRNTINKNEITTKDITSALEFTYSKKKPIYGSSDPDNNIYIECNPTGADGEIMVEKSKEGYFDSMSLSLLSSIDTGGNLGSSILYTILYILILFIVIFGIIILFKYLGSKINCTSSNKKVQSGGFKKYGGSCNKILKSKLKL